MKTGIVIPWRPQPSRIAPFEFVVSWYKAMYPDAPIYISDSKSEKFSVSAARNAGCRQAFADGCDVVIVSDADVLIEKEYLDQAIDHCRKRNSLSFPYTWCGRASYERSQGIMYDKQPWVDGSDVNYIGLIVGAICVISKIAFEDINGWDERFYEWGHEDIAFELTFRYLHGDVKRFDGKVVMLYHEDRDMSNEPNNLSRYHLYVKTAEELGEQGLRDLIKDNML